MDKPEQKSPTEPLDIQRKTEAIMSGERAVDKMYPHIPPDYKVPFLHIGTDKQLFLDNFILDHLEGVERVFPKPERTPEPIISTRELPWERSMAKGYFSYWAFVLAFLWVFTQFASDFPSNDTLQVRFFSSVILARI